MKLNSQAFALSLGITGGLSFIICAALVAVSPQAAAGFFSWWFHYNLTALARQVTFASFIGGTVLTFVFGYVFGWVTAFFYNKFAKEQ